jgi:hypothetical protein
MKLKDEIERRPGDQRSSDGKGNLASIGPYIVALPFNPLTSMITE